MILQPKAQLQTAPETLSQAGVGQNLHHSRNTIPGSAACSPVVSRSPSHPDSSEPGLPSPLRGLSVLILTDPTLGLLKDRVSPEPPGHPGPGFGTAGHGLILGTLPLPAQVWFTASARKMILYSYYRRMNPGSEGLGGHCPLPTWPQLLGAPEKRGPLFQVGRLG